MVIKFIDGVSEDGKYRLEVVDGKYKVVEIETSTESEVKASYKATGSETIPESRIAKAIQKSVEENRGVYTVYFNYKEQRTLGGSQWGYITVVVETNQKETATNVILAAKSELSKVVTTNQDSNYPSAYGYEGGYWIYVGCKIGYGEQVSENFFNSYAGTLYNTNDETEYYSYNDTLPSGSYIYNDTSLIEYYRKD